MIDEEKVLKYIQQEMDAIEHQESSNVNYSSLGYVHYGQKQAYSDIKYYIERLSRIAEC